VTPSAAGRLAAFAAANAFPIALACVLAIALAVLSPGLLVTDSWMTLVAGREIVENGIPHRETLTVIAAGRDWIDQQWLAQLFWYGVHRIGGLAAVAIVDVLLVVGAVASAMAAARLLGASARATFFVSTACLFTAPWSWQIRAQAFALPLFVWTLWLAADHVRRPSRRILVALPLLLLWANVHGSVLLGAGIVGLAAVWVAVRDRRPAGIGVAVAAVLCALLTPYGLDIVSYYHRLLVDPPFGDAIIEWKRTTPMGLTAIFFVVAVAAVVLVAWQRRRLTAFEIVVLALLLVTALDAVRGIVWFTLAVAVLVPNAVDGALRGEDSVRLPRANVILAAGFVAAAVLTLGAVATRPASWFERTWPDGVLAAVRSAGPDARVYPSDRHADWLLWHIPDLRGRLAYDVRFEILSKEQFRTLAAFDGEHGRHWKRAADGYRVVVVDESSVPSHTADFLAEPGARTAYRDEDVAVIIRRTG
jgi:hypothetical protein